MISDGFIFNMVEQATNFPAPVEQVLTDDEGWFTLVSLTGGSYRLEARQGGYATRYETDVVVSEERPARDMTIVLGEGATVAGKVVDESGKPIAGARVVALKDMGRRFFGASTLERDVALTDVGGSYALDTLTLGTTYRLGVIAEGYAPIFEMSGVELMDKVQKKDFQLVQGGSIVGRVLRKDNAEPVAGAQVVVAVGRMFGGRARRRRGTEGGHGPRHHRRGRDLPHREPHARPRHVGPGEVLRLRHLHRVHVDRQRLVRRRARRRGREVLVELEPGGSVAGTVTDAKTNAADPLRRGDGAAARQPHARHVHRQPLRPGGRPGQVHGLRRAARRVRRDRDRARATPPPTPTPTTRSSRFPRRAASSRATSR